MAFNGVFIELGGWSTWASVAVPARLGFAAHIAYLGGAPPAEADRLWDHSVSVWVAETSGLLLLCLVYVLLAGIALEYRLARPGALRRGA